MEKDPVCGMKVSESAAKEKLISQGQTYYFCSPLCKRMFEREPQKYVSSLQDEDKSSA